jgi:VanZ family protein
MNKQFLVASSWTILLIFLSLISKDSASKISLFDFQGSDKVGHFLFYAILSFLWANAFHSSKIKNRFTFVFIFCSILGILLEFLQEYITQGRKFEYFDMIVNALGVLFGLWVFKKIIQYHS